ncbi:MAG: hypothetical protein WAO58_00890 [Fimbriimonadaceae bacterium]
MNKFALICLLGIASGFSFGQDCCDKDKKSEKKQQTVKPQEGCAMEKSAKTEDCDMGAKKGAETCSSAKTEAAKYKIYVVGEGYRFFGCEEDAAKTYMNLLASTKKSGTIQKVVRKATS